MRSLLPVCMFLILKSPIVKPCKRPSTSNEIEDSDTLSLGSEYESMGNEVPCLTFWGLQAKRHFFKNMI